MRMRYFKLGILAISGLLFLAAPNLVTPDNNNIYPNTEKIVVRAEAIDLHKLSPDEIIKLTSDAKLSKDLAMLLRIHFSEVQESERASFNLAKLLPTAKLLEVLKCTDFNSPNWISCMHSALIHNESESIRKYAIEVFPRLPVIPRAILYVRFREQNWDDLLNYARADQKSREIIFVINWDVSQPNLGCVASRYLLHFE